MKYVNIVCEQCGSPFEKSKNEYNRKKKLGTKFFCSLRCAGKDNYEQLKPTWGDFSHNLKLGSNKDEFSDFREYFRRCKRRGKNVSLTLNDLKMQWETQSGRCIYSNIPLCHPSLIGDNDPIFTASLDRIDSNFGYVAGNVQFVSMAMNYAKNRMSHEQTLKFCEILSRSRTSQ